MQELCSNPGCEHPIYKKSLHPDLPFSFQHICKRCWEEQKKVNWMGEVLPEEFEDYGDSDSAPHLKQSERASAP